MNELTHVRRLRAEVPEDLDMPAAEDRLRAEIAEARKTPARARKLRWTLIPAGIAATAIAVALVTVPWSDGSSAEAVALMARAAQTALHTPASPPRNDQYIYQETVEKLRPAGRPYTRYRSEWLSVDGSKPGLIRERNVIPAGTPAPPAEEMRPDGETALRACGATPPLSRPYIGSLPSRPADVLKLLDERAGDGGRGERLWSAATDMADTAMAPAARASFYRALAEIPGVGVAADSVDASGRHGVALTRTSDGVREELIFDRTTYAVLGERTLDEKGTEFSSTALLKTAVVDKAPAPRPGTSEDTC
ncbi:CU044_5270 family protein [Actinomadura gamaensis]|uniref:CU044_5270 family protein n=1 Tax=Actinomadura gamaensis TaxID=1763541 RepID=A0ABV9TP40_9ACTN